MKKKHSFSAIQNLKEWVSVKASPVDEIMGLHDIRVLSHLVITCFHLMVVVSESPYINRDKFLQVSFRVYNVLSLKSLRELKKKPSTVGALSPIYADKPCVFFV